MMNYMQPFVKTRDRTLATAGFFALAAMLTGPIYRSMGLSVMMCVLAFTFLYVAVVGFERPMKNYQRAIVIVESLLLVLPLYLIVLALVLYSMQFVK